MQPTRREAVALNVGWLYAQDATTQEVRKVPVRLRSTDYRLETLRRTGEATELRVQEPTCFELVSDRPYEWALWVSLSGWLGDFALFNVEEDRTSYLVWVQGMEIAVSQVSTSVDRCVALCEYLQGRQKILQRVSFCPVRKLAPRVFHWQAGETHNAQRLEIRFESLSRDAEGNLELTLRDPGSADRLTVACVDSAWRLVEQPTTEDTGANHQ